MALPADLDFARDPEASPTRMNRAMAAIDQRFKALEIPAKMLDQVLAQIQAIGLQRLNDAIKPIYDEAAALTSLGALLSAHSGSTLPIATGPAIFVVDEAQLATFAFSYWMSAASDDGDAAMSGRILAYDRATGHLTMQVMETFGAGTLAGWTLSPSSPPLLTAAVVDGGAYDAPGASVPYSYTPTATASDGGTY